MSETRSNAQSQQRRDIAAGAAFGLLGFLIVLAVAGAWWLMGANSELEAENRALRAELDEIQASGTEAAGRLEQLKAIFDRAARLDPDDPDAPLRRALQLLEQLGPITQEELDAIPQLLKEAKDAKAQLAVLRAELRHTRLERDNLMRRGRGTTFPSCWIDDQGGTEFVFDIAIRDDGILVKDIAPAHRAQDPVWRQVPQFPRDTLISKSVFQAATEPFLRWGRKEECRFFVVLRDETGDASKAVYKELRAWVEGHFYVLLR